MAKNKYRELEYWQQREFNDFAASYMFFAFNKEQFAEGLEKLGLTDESAKGNLASTIGGGFMLKSRLADYNAMLDSFHDERERQIAADATGEGFIKDMFCAIMDDHEYSYTQDDVEILRLLGLKPRDLEENKALAKGFMLAQRAHAM